jgi:hypothetical protein
MGSSLTPLGSEMAGTPDGEVPAWTGGLSSPPAGVNFDPKKMNPPNPFSSDPVKATITAANMAQF